MQEAERALKEKELKQKGIILRSKIIVVFLFKFFLFIFVFPVS
jgi:hypothetical protein